MIESTPHPLVIRLLDVQRSRDLSHAEMARRLKIEPATWTRLRQNKTQPSLRVVQAAVSAFPELRSFCVELLMIRTETFDDQQKTAEVA
jgi:transcriptional regulator with XRE-family HTH domain